MKERSFLDTNILVYADDHDAGEKNRKAREIVRDALVTRRGAISTQVLQEYYVIATKKLGVDPATARRKVELLASIDVIRIETSTILDAIDLVRLHSFSFWDALILRCASLAGCTRLLSEDMQHGQVVAGVRIENPFTR